MSKLKKTRRAFVVELALVFLVERLPSGSKIAIGRVRNFDGAIQ
jgi:hypothetical protein